MALSFETINLAISVAGLVICILGLLLAIMGSMPERRIKRYFVAFFFVLVIYVASDLIGQFGTDPVFRTVMLFVESVSSSVLMLLLTGFLLEQGGETKWYRSPSFRVAAVLWLAYIALLIYTQFSVTIYYYDAQGVYHRGPFYSLLLVPPVLIMLQNLLVLWRSRKRFSRRQTLAFAVYILVPMLTMLLQMLFYGLYVIVLGTAVSALFMFMYIQRDQTERFAEQEAENARLRMDIMLSQIQPHFMYNTLGAIGHLCSNDPEAKAAIRQFSRYLRHNMDSLTQSKPIPFTTELEHTKAYLALEQLRFPDELKVEYDLQCTAFLLPTLTLQPLAENAVRHGIRRSESGSGTLRISTRETPDHYEITVADDGAGFDPAGDSAGGDGQPHIGLSNVRERLRRLCGGELRIESEPGKGCRATILLPKESSGIRDQGSGESHADIRN